MKRLTALGANIFAGGFSLGVSKHFKLLGHLEHDDYGAAVSHKNLGVPVYVGTDQWPEKLTRFDFLYSNPPCAIWSLASGRGGQNWQKDPRLQRIRDIFGLIDRYKPTVWCWESVCQAFEIGRPVVEELADQAAKRGYSATYLLIDAAYLGTPQHRKRFFLVLHKVELNFDIPDFNKVQSAGSALKGVKPNRELLWNINSPLENKVLKHTKPGQRLQDAFDRLYPRPKIGSRGQKLGRPSFLKRRLDPKKPSGVVIGNVLFHPTANRALAVNECAALCGYPQSWAWPRSDGYNLIARGVMPPVGEWLARYVAKAIRKGKKITKPKRFIVDFRNPPGLVKEVGKLPDQIDLDWKPQTLGRRPARNAQARSSSRLAPRMPRELESLAEATRRGIPDKNGRVKIQQALASLKKGKRPESSGMLIRARLLEGKKPDVEIVNEVLKHYEGRKTTIADVSYHRGKMRRAGMI